MLPMLEQLDSISNSRFSNLWSQAVSPELRQRLWLLDERENEPRETEEDYWRWNFRSPGRAGVGYIRRSGGISSSSQGRCKKLCNRSSFLGFGCFI